MNDKRLHAAIRRQVDDFAGDLLSGADRETIERHLEGCPECRDRLAALRMARTMARRGLADPGSDDLLAARIRSALDAEDHLQSRTPRSKSFGVGWRWLAAAGLILVAALGTWLATRSRVDVPATISKSYAQRSGNSLLALQTSDPAILESFFAARGLPAGRVFDFGMMGWSLTGGGPWNVDRETGAGFAYRSGERELWCIMYRGRVPEGALEVRQHEGIELHVFRRQDSTLVFWQEGSVVCVLVSDIPSEDVIELAIAKAIRV